MKKMWCLPMNYTGEEYPITQSYVLELAELYPAVDIMQELRAMKGWCDANPRKRKTAGGMKRFINAWISKVQNRGGTPGYLRKMQSIIKLRLID